MKTRVISGIAIVVIMGLVLCAMYTPVFGVFFALLSAVACYEILRITKVYNKGVIILSSAFAFIVPLFAEYTFKISFKIAILIFIFAQLTIMLVKYKEIKFRNIAASIYAGVFIPFCFSTFILVRDLYEAYPKVIDKKQALFLVVLGVSCSWITDTCAYFVGVKFGKHKMTPTISPKKTIEGAVGGVLGCLVLNMIILYIFNTYLFTTPFLSYVILGLISVLLSCSSMCGDLVASIIKRNYDAKDYGNLIPGHGGIMDRFDSCLFVMPTLYIVITLIFTYDKF